MALGTFEQLPGISYSVDNFEASVYEPGGTASQTVIGAAQPWEIRVSWDTSDFWSGLLTGNWKIECYVEGIGPSGDALAGAPLVVPLVFTGAPNSPLSYAPPITVVPVAGCPVPFPVGSTSLPMKLVTTVTATDLGGNTYPMAGYIEGPILQFHR